MRLLFLGFFLCFSMCLGRQSELWLRLSLDFFADYVQFYGIGGVHFLKSLDWAPTWSRFVLNSFRLGSSVAVLDWKQNRSLTFTSHLTRPSLVVLPFFNQDQSRTFEQILRGITAEELRILLFSDAAFRKVLSSVYLPLLNMVQVAVVSETEVVLWEQYQVKEDLPRRLSQVGVWRPRSTNILCATCKTTAVGVRDDSTAVASMSHLLMSKTHGVVSQEGKGILVAFQSDVAVRRTDLEGVVLNCTAEKWRPATILKWDSAGSLMVSGSFIEVVQYFESNLNFSCRWARSKDETWGVRRPDGTWNGMVGDLIAGRADVAVGVALSPGRDESVDFTLQINEGGYYLVIRRPGTNTGLTWSSYTQEFSWGSWASAGAFLLLLAGALTFVTWRQPGGLGKVPFSEALLIAFGAVCQQGSTLNVSGTSSRILFFTIFLFGTVLYTYYCTFLISALSVAKSNLPFTNLAGLLRLGTYQLVVASGTIIEATIKSSTSPLYQRAWENIVHGAPDSFASHYTDCALRALKKRRACLLEISEYMYEHSRNLELVALTEKKYGRFSVGIAVQDRSPLRKLFNAQLVQMKSSGVLNKILTKWSIAPPSTSSTSVPAMSMGSMASAFAILSIGSLAAFLALGGEILHHRWRGAKAKGSRGWGGAATKVE